MTTLIEDVARALYDSKLVRSRYIYEWDEMNEDVGDFREDAREAAQAAIRAVLEHMIKYEVFDPQFLAKSHNIPLTGGE